MHSSSARLVTGEYVIHALPDSIKSPEYVFVFHIAPRHCEPFFGYEVLSVPGLFNALVLDWVSPKCNTLMQTAVG